MSSDETKKDSPPLYIVYDSQDKIELFFWDRKAAFMCMLDLELSTSKENAVGLYELSKTGPFGQLQNSEKQVLAFSKEKIMACIEKLDVDLETLCISSMKPRPDCW